MQVVTPDALYDATERLYGHARVENGTLYMSGQVGRDSPGDVAGSDVESQTRRAVDNVGVILETVDEDFTSIAKITSYFTDIRADFSTYKGVWDDIFEEPYPAHTAIGVEALAAPDLRIELDAGVPLSD